MTSGIYKITNNITNKSYIGCSQNIHNRFKQHIRTQKYLIGESIKEYGEVNFKFEVLLECSKEEFNHYEKYYIELHNTITPNGYNLTSGGEHKKIISNETKLKMSNSAKLRHRDNGFSNEVRNKISTNVKKSITPEIRNKISQAAKTQKRRCGPRDNEHCKKKVMYNNVVYNSVKECKQKNKLNKKKYKKLKEQNMIIYVNNTNI